MTDRNDEKLVAAYLEGDRQALEILIRRHLKPIFWFVHKYVGNAQDAEDITQEVFVKIWNNLNKFDPKKSFSTWIFSIAKNASIDFLKKKRAFNFSDFAGEGGENVLLNTLRDESLLPDEGLEQKNVGRALAAAVGGLSQKHSIVFEMHYDRGLNFREIAEALGEPLYTIKSRYRRALIALQKIIQNI